MLQCKTTEHPIILSMQNMISCFLIGEMWHGQIPDMIYDVQRKWTCLCFRAQNTLQRPISCKMRFIAHFVKPSTGLYPANLSRCQNVVLNAEVEPGDPALFSLSTGLFAAVCLYRRPIQPRLMALNVRGLMIDSLIDGTLTSDGPTGRRGFDSASV